jgi:hypothetical protein
VYIINLLFNSILSIVYLISFFYITDFDINNNKIFNIILLIIFFISFPALAVLLNNLFLFIIRYKNWKGWLKIPQRFYKIFTNIEAGFAIISIAPLIGIIFIYKEKFSPFINNTSNVLKININILITIFVTLYCIIGVFLMKLIRIIFMKSDNPDIDVLELWKKQD